MMADIEVYLDSEGLCPRIGLLRTYRRRSQESVTFEYDAAWSSKQDCFPIEPSMPIGPGVFRPSGGHGMFGALGDSAPDTWGRNLMRRQERRTAKRQGRAVRALQESDFLLGVADCTRLGALRMKRAGESAFQAPLEAGVPNTLALGTLLGVCERIEFDEDTDDDLSLLLGPGSSLGGARPKASVTDVDGSLSLAKFPKTTDDYSMERWEAIAMDLAMDAGIRTAPHRLIEVRGKLVLLSRRFDRHGEVRIPFLSAMTMTGRRDREQGSYLEIVDALSEHGANAKPDRAELFRRVAFSVLVSNTDDHLRNHGFLRMDSSGWTLSPAYDINPTPTYVKPRILSTAIDMDDGTCSIDLLRSVAEEFALGLTGADAIIAGVATVTRKWRSAAMRRNAPRGEIDRMAGAFQHSDLRDALTLSARC